MLKRGSILFVGLLLLGNLSAQEAEDIRGPKPMVRIPIPEKPAYALWSGIGGGVLLLGILALWWKRRASRERLRKPAEIALTSLSEIERQHEALAAEAFANRAAQAVRTYIAVRFGIAAPRRTTEEFLRDLAGDASPLAGEGNDLRAFLKSCDLAKFAGSGLDATQRGELLQAARDFIRSTSQATP